MTEAKLPTLNFILDIGDISSARGTEAVLPEVHNYHIINRGCLKS